MYGAMLPLSSSRPSIAPSRGHACDEEKLKVVNDDREAACEAASRARPVPAPGQCAPRIYTPTY